jgi:pimeloyl-ACP methyl ester carboxylesterase
MTIVFVHGNPETPAVWAPLLAELDRIDVLTLQLPGFGVPAPPGWTATKEEYVDWLAAQIERIGHPVDLVGHDWGGGFTLRLACTRPDLLRSWVSDVAGLLAPDYEWHQFAQIWQTPGDGEAFFEQSLATPRADRIAQYRSIGITEAAAEAFVDASGPEMARCVLALYRSAAQPAMRTWGLDRAAAAARPGLVISAVNDPFTGGHASSQTMAADMGASFAVLPNVGHWWMLENPALGARTLTDFWSTISD